MDERRSPRPGSHTPDADLDLLLDESDSRWADPRAPSHGRRRATRHGRRDERADPRRARQPVASLSGRAARARASPAARRPRRPPTRCSPQNSERPTRSTGSRSAPAASRRRPAASIAPSRRWSPAARRQSSSADAGGGRRLGQDLGVVEVEAAAEREPAGGEHERARRGPARPRSAAARIAAGTWRGKRSGHTSGRRSAAARALGGRAQLLDALGVVGRGSGAAASPSDAGVHVTCGERALDPLGGEIRERAGEVEEELRARRARACASCADARGAPCARSMSSPIASSAFVRSLEATRLSTTPCLRLSNDCASRELAQKFM